MPTDYQLLRFQKLLESAGAYPEVVETVSRIFQRIPHLTQELSTKAEDEETSLSLRKRRFIELVVDKVGHFFKLKNASQLWGLSNQVKNIIQDN